VNEMELETVDTVIKVSMGIGALIVLLAAWVTQRNEPFF